MALPRRSGPSLIDTWTARTHERDVIGSPNAREGCHSSNLKTLSMLHAFTLGSGDSIFSDILPSIAQAQFEVLFVTCFWAKSSSLDRVSSCLRNLSKRALERESKVRVRICLSSLSLLQKLYHTSSPAGRTYSPSVWVKKFGLPPPEDLRGLDLEIKSVFIRPFSVMHPKFIVIDRKYLYLPSCNVSWENWLEGCLQASGPLVNHFVNFWQDFWANDVDKRSSSSTVSQEVDVSAPEFHRTVSQPSLSRPFASTVGCKKVLLDLANAETAFLLSPHHANPRFRPFPWQPAIPPPQTPLNTFLLHAFDNAASKIYIQTPNITSPPVLKALLVALKRGVNIHIVTSERLMLLEQLVTAGTTTVRCLRRLKDQHQQLHAERQKPLLDEEQGPNQSLGSLRIEFFVKGFSDAQLQLSPEPVQSHLKLTVVDNQTIVFGSGNMDRASWFTSQELGVAIVSPSLAGSVMRSLEECLASRTKLDFDG